MTFLSISFLWVLLGIPLVIILHFVRLRPKKTQVSAIFLWQRAKNLTSSQRRFTPTWLLLLQVLFIAFTALALAQPRLTVETLERVLIIDASASMAAKDSEGQRLARATTQAESLFKGAKVALVRAGLDATVLRDLTDNHVELKKALQTLRAADMHADINRSVDLAKSIAPKAELHLFSDGIPPENLEVNFHPITGDAQNIGITNFELLDNQAFVSVLNTSLRPYEVTLHIDYQNRMVAKSTLLIPSQNQTHLSLPIEGKEGIYHAYLEVPSWDGLDLDNEVFLDHQQLRVLISPPENLIEKALTAIPNLKVRSSSRINGVYDVLVTTSNNFASLNSETGQYFLYEQQNSNPAQTMVDWDSVHPLLRFVDLTSVTVNPADAQPEGDWQILARTENLSPAILYSTKPEITVVALNFHPSQSNLKNRNAFPILVTNTMRQFKQDRSLPLGTPLLAENVLFNGESTADKRAYDIGIYNLNNINYSVNLLNAAESRLALVDTNLVKNVSNQEAEPIKSEVALELWLLVGALGFLVLEWFWRSRLNKFA